MNHRQPVSSTPSFLRITFLLVPLLSTTSYVHAADSTWLLPVDGSFNDPVNWNAGVPTSNDRSLFDQSGSYTVMFADNVQTTTAGLSVSAGDVTFDTLNGSYRAYNPGTNETSYLGGTLANSPALRMNTGELDLYRMEMATGADTAAALVLSGADTRLSTEQYFITGKGSNNLSTSTGGSSAIDISGGAQLSATSFYLSTKIGSDTTLNVDGAGSRISASNTFYFGELNPFTYKGDGSSVEVNLTNGAVLDSLYGFSTRGLGTRTVTIDGVGSKVTGGGIVFGADAESTETLTVTNGGQIDASSLSIYSRGEMTIIGDATSQIDAGRLSIGVGDVTIGDGLSMNVGSVSVGSTSFFNDLPVASLTLEDAGTNLSSAGRLVVGGDGTATSAFTVGDGVTAQFMGEIRMNEGANVFINGGSVIAEAVKVNYGDLAVRSGSLTAGNIALGSADWVLDTTAAGSTTTVDASINTSGAVTVGDTTQAILTLGSTGGSSAIGSLAIGANAGSAGTVTVLDDLTVADSVSVGGEAASAGGAGLLALQSGITQAIKLAVWSGGTVTVAGPATLSVEQLLIEGAGFTQDGRLKANQVSGNVSNNGEFFVGTDDDVYTDLALSGDFTQTADGSLFMSIDKLIAGAGADFLNISGDAALAGNLYIDIERFSLPEVGATFNLISAAAILGSFENIFVSDTYGAGLAFSQIVDPLGNEVLQLTVVTGVPVPAAVWLFGSGLLALAGIRRHRAKRV